MFIHIPLGNKFLLTHKAFKRSGVNMLPKVNFKISSDVVLVSASFEQTMQFAIVLVLFQMDREQMERSKFFLAGWKGAEVRRLISIFVG